MVNERRRALAGGLWRAGRRREETATRAASIAWPWSAAGRQLLTTERAALRRQPRLALSRLGSEMNPLLSRLGSGFRAWTRARARRRGLRAHGEEDASCGARTAANGLQGLFVAGHAAGCRIHIHRVNHGGAIA